MTVLDKVVAAITPEPSDEKIAETRAAARAMASGVGWLTMVLDHHDEIEAAFAAVKGATTITGRRTAQKALGLILTGHSLAEETVIYPAMALDDQRRHSGEAYTEQSAAKVKLAALDGLEPMSQDYLDKLEHLRAAVAHHVYEEESAWFLDLRSNADGATNSRMTRRYREEFERYMGPDDPTIG